MARVILAMSIIALSAWTVSGSLLYSGVAFALRALSLCNLILGRYRNNDYFHRQFRHNHNNSFAFMSACFDSEVGDDFWYKRCIARDLETLANVLYGLSRGIGCVSLCAKLKLDPMLN